MPNCQSNDADDEAEYAQILQTERYMFAWVLERYGNIDAAKAAKLAMERYPYDPPDDSYRWLMFHDEAWDWAMLFLHADEAGNYWINHPEFAEPPPEYRELEITPQMIEQFYQQIND